MPENIEVPIEIYQGDLFEMPIFFLDNDMEPIPLTGYSAKMQIRSTRTEDEDQTPILEATTDNGYLVIDAENGEIDVVIPSTVTALLPAGFVGVYDIFIYSKTITGLDTMILNGPVTIIGGVTK